MLLLLYRWPSAFSLFESTERVLTRQLAQIKAPSEAVWSIDCDSGEEWAAAYSRSHLGFSELPVSGQLAQSVSWRGNVEVIKLKEVGVSALLPLTQL